MDKIRRVNWAILVDEEDESDPISGPGIES